MTQPEITAFLGLFVQIKRHMSPLQENWMEIEHIFDNIQLSKYGDGY